MSNKLNNLTAASSLPSSPRFKKDQLLSCNPILVNEQKVKLTAFLSKFEIIPHNFDLYIQAFTHSSYTHCNKAVDNNFHYERMEFLGDSIINFCLTHYLYNKFPNANEGELTLMRKTAIQKESFSMIVEHFNLISILRVGKSGRYQNFNFSEKFLSNLYESLTAAIFLDQGLEKTTQFLEFTLYDYINKNKFQKICDYKSTLQEIIQKNPPCQIFYDDMRKNSKKSQKHHFVSTIYLIKNQKKFIIGEGKGTNKKKAQQLAAKVAIRKVKNHLSK